MRVFGATLFLAAILTVGVSLSSGQQPGFGGGFGGFGNVQPTNPITLATRPDVRADLDITDQQMDKLPAAALKALAEVLNDKQLKRLHQIDMQLRGDNALLDGSVQKDLKISAEQSKKIKSVLDDAIKERADAVQNGDFGKLGDIQTETTEKIQAVLNAEQKTSLKSMFGAEFKAQKGGKGGGGFKKGV